MIGSRLYYFILVYVVLSRLVHYAICVTFHSASSSVPHLPFAPVVRLSYTLSSLIVDSAVVHLAQSLCLHRLPRSLQTLVLVALPCFKTARILNCMLIVYQADVHKPSVL